MDTTRLKEYFNGLQTRIVSELETFDGQPFRTDSWLRPEGGGGISRLIEGGKSPSPEAVAGAADLKALM